MSSWNPLSSGGGDGGRRAGNQSNSGGQASMSGPGANSAATGTNPVPAASRIAIPSFREVHQLQQQQRGPSVPNFFQPKSATASTRPVGVAASAAPSFNPFADEGPNKRPRTNEPSTTQQAGPPSSGSGLQLPPFRGRPGARPPEKLPTSSPAHQPGPAPSNPARSVAPLKPTLGLPQYRDGVGNLNRGVNQAQGMGRGSMAAGSGSTQWNSQSSTGFGQTGTGFGQSGTAVGSNSRFGGVGTAGPGPMNSGGQPVGSGNWSGGVRPGGTTVNQTTQPGPNTLNNQVLPANAILVSKRQQGNPILKHIRNVRWVLSDIVPDYQLGQHTCALFLSLRYHLLHPDYILHRMKELQKAYRLSVVVCHVDVEDVIKPLAQITKLTISNDCTLICAWSPEECARYLETLKSYESKPATAIQERVEHDYVSRLTSALTGVRGINKTDAVTLGTTFGSLADIIRGKAEAFSACPGIGPTKVHRLVEAFHEPFKKVLQASTIPSTTTPTKQPGAKKTTAATSSKQPLSQEPGGADDAPSGADCAVAEEPTSKEVRGDADKVGSGEAQATGAIAKEKDAVGDEAGWQNEHVERGGEEEGGLQSCNNADVEGDGRMGGMGGELFGLTGLQEEDYEWLLGQEREDSEGDGGGEVGEEQDSAGEEDDDFVEHPSATDAAGRVARVAGGKSLASGSKDKTKLREKKHRTFQRPRFLPREGSHQLSQISQPALAIRGDESEDEFAVDEEF